MKIVEINKMKFVELYLNKLFLNRNLYIRKDRDLLNVNDYIINLDDLTNGKTFAEESVLLEYEKRKLSVEDN